MTGIELIAAERQRQIDAEGYNPSHDDTHTHDQLACSAAAYAAPARFRADLHGLWPFQSCEFKPTPDNRIRELEKAGALIAAEIDRLQRAGDCNAKVVVPTMAPIPPHPQGNEVS